MIALVQRVIGASVEVEASGHRAQIGIGLCVLLGVEPADDEASSKWMASKLARLRIFRDDADKMNRSVVDIGGSVLLVSQFTLCGDCSQGNRPSFIGAAPPEQGRRLYEQVGAALKIEHALPVEYGEFGASMLVHIDNDGPVTLIVRSPGAGPVV